VAYTVVRGVDGARDTFMLEGFQEEQRTGNIQAISPNNHAKNEGRSREVKKDSGDRQCGVLEHCRTPHATTGLISVEDSLSGRRSPQTPSQHEHMLTITARLMQKQIS
jgi:hypothetical protein